MNNNLIKKIQTFSNRFSLLNKEQKIIIGVSGGADSVCLLNILSELRKKYKFEILIAHINYGLRGNDSNKDEEFVKKLSKKYGFKIVIKEIQGLNLNKVNESELRNIRYDFFERIRKQKKFDVVAVAHNQDDQAETILMRLLRGSGLQGLKSMSPKKGKIIRPLLKISRKEILNYLKENNLSHRIDRSNKDIRFFRNKIRQQLMPYLEKEYNPAIKKTLAEAVENISDDYDFIDNNSRKKWSKISSVEGSNKVDFSIYEIRKEHLAIQRQIIRQLIFKIKGDLIDIENSHIEEILKIIISNKNKRQIKEFANLKIERKGDRLQISVLID